MFTKLLSLIDLVAAAFVLLNLVHFLPLGFVKYAAFYLIIKGSVFLLFSKDFASVVDVLFGLYLLALSAGIYSNNFLGILAVIWLIQKGALGLA